MYETFTLTDPSFQENSKKELHIFLQLMQEHLYFISFDPAENKFIKLVDYHFQAAVFNIDSNDLKSEIPELTMDSSKKVLAINNENSSLVPSAFMKKDISEDILKLNFNISEDKECQWEHIPAIDSYLVYGRGKEFLKIASLFRPDKSIHCSSALLNSLLAKTYYSDSKDMFIDISESFFRIFLINNRKFELFNSYPYKNSEDILYHLMNVTDHFEFNTNTDNYHFSGLITKDSDFYELLQKYIRYPFFLRKPENYQYSTVFEDQSMHTYYNLFSIASCA
ncbi:MAG: DUF3822 family protein [Bacteroidetes bacterium]|nr:DUF3822 family protein [Bacteroidota bacterium]